MVNLKGLSVRQVSGDLVMRNVSVGQLLLCEKDEGKRTMISKGSVYRVTHTRPSTISSAHVMLRLDIEYCRMHWFSSSRFTQHGKVIFQGEA